MLSNMEPLTAEEINWWKESMAQEMERLSKKARRLPYPYGWRAKYKRERKKAQESMRAHAAVVD